MCEVINRLLYDGLFEGDGFHELSSICENGKGCTQCSNRIANNTTICSSF